MPEGLVVPEHLHDGAQIYFVLEGTYVETLRGRPNLLGPGAAWFRPPRERHENAVVGDESALTLIVTFDGGRFASVERRCSAPQRLQSLLLDDVREEIVREMHRADAQTMMALEGWSLLLLSRVARLIGADETATPEWLGDAVQYIERAYSGPLSLAIVAAHVGIHPATLAAAFRRFHGTSVGQFIRDLRLRARARRARGIAASDQRDRSRCRLLRSGTFRTALQAALRRIARRNALMFRTASRFLTDRRGAADRCSSRAACGRTWDLRISEARRRRSAIR